MWDTHHISYILKMPLDHKYPIQNRPFYSCVLTHSCQAFNLEWGWRWPCCDGDQYLVGMITKYLHLKSSNVCNITRSPLASLLFKGLATKHATVKWTTGENLNDTFQSIVKPTVFLELNSRKIVLFPQEMVFIFFNRLATRTDTYHICCRTSRYSEVWCIKIHRKDSHGNYM